MMNNDAIRRTIGTSMKLNHQESRDVNNIDLAHISKDLGYTLVQTRRLDEIDGFFYELIHDQTGAKHIHISRKDTENTFGVAFKTVPKDSTGVAHILEHTVLCGSGKYPVRDPFFSMIKRSLNTFMNAFTASDWTMYPFATENRTDFYNLLGIYLDAAFFPRIDDLSFKQEGHRLELDSQSGKLAYKGVVYNEMKGAMSSPNQVMVRSLLNALYPDTTYHYNSGGDPMKIPDLTHEDLKAFHAGHYHPSNAFFYTYGDIPLADHLSYIKEAVLDHFTAITPDTDVPTQPRWTAPAEKIYSYPLGSEESMDKKAQVCLAWLMADTRDSVEVLSLIILEHILLGNAASPLRQALIESELGSALSDGTGYDPENKDTMFACGLKDVNPEDAPEIERIILDTLKGLVETGIDASLIESAIHQIEFYRKEITNSPYPYGLKLLMWVAGVWMHGGDPVSCLLIDDDLEQVNQKLASGPFLENQIRRYFLENSHRVRMTLAPDQQLAEETEKKIREQLDRVHAGLSEEALEQIRSDQEKLKALQESEEDLSCLPTLSLDEIPPTIKTVSSTREIPFPPLYCYNQSTSGIFYYSSIVETNQLPEPLIHMAPFFASSFSKSGTRKRSYVDMARLIDARTGGLGLSTHSRTRYDGSASCMPFISFSGKCLNRNIAEMYAIIGELILEVGFDDHKRLKTLLKEYQAAMESAVVQNGHRLAISLSCRHLTPSTRLSELWHGVHQLQFIRQTAADLTDEKLQSIAEQLNQISTRLFHQDNMKIAVVGEDEHLALGEGKAGELQHQLSPSAQPVSTGADRFISSPATFEGWYTQSAVSFVAQSFKVVNMGHRDAPALSLIGKLLRSKYLHREIREKGGAYGGFALYNAEDGIFSLASYRDPHIIATLNAFKGACDFIRNGQYSDEDVREAILQVCSDIDKPDTPSTAARKSFYRKMVGLSDDVRREYKKRLLSLTLKDIRAAAEVYFDPNTMASSVAVISGKEKLEQANKHLKGDLPLTLQAI